MSRSYRKPYSAVNGVTSAARDKRFASRGVRRKQNQWLRDTAEFDDSLAPHRLECSGNEVYGWGRDGRQRIQLPNSRDRSSFCLEKPESDESGLPGHGTPKEWPPCWFVRLRRK